MKRVRLKIIVSAIAILGIMAPSAHADVAFSTDNVLTSSTILNSPCAGTWLDDGNRWQVTANKDVNLSSVSFYMASSVQLISGTTTILADNANTPGATIGTLGLEGTLSPDAVATYTTSNPIHLTDGLKYWVQIDDFGACAVGTPQDFTGTAFTVQNSDGSVTHWYRNTNFTQLFFNVEFALYGSITFPFTWTTYFDGNGATSGTAPSPIFVAYGGNAGFNLPGNVGRSTNSTSNAVLTRTGYTFLGWSTSSTATSPMTLTNYQFTPTGDTVLYAVWKANS